jgi:hypothetical protein
MDDHIDLVSELLNQTEPELRNVPADKSDIQNIENHQRSDTTNDKKKISSFAVHEPPIEALPLVLERLNIKMYEFYKTPKALIFSVTLSVISVIASNYGDIVIDSRKIPPSLSCLIAGESGERKSSVEAPLTKPIKEHFKKKNREALDNAKREDDGKSKSGECPFIPSPIISDSTVEAILKTLEKVAVIYLSSDEGGSIIFGHSMANRERSIATVATYSKLWDGSPINQARVGRNTVPLHDRRVVICLMIQPNILSRVLSNPDFSAQGYTNRQLICYPRSKIGERLYCGENIYKTKEYKQFQAKVNKLLENIDLEYADREAKVNSSIEMDWRPGEYIGRKFKLSVEANTLWIEFYNEIELSCAPNGDLYDVKGYAAKIAEQALRIAGTLAIFEDPEELIIDVSFVRSGIDIARYYLNEYCRLIRESVVDEIVEDAEKLKCWIKKNAVSSGGSRYIYSAKILQKGPVCARQRKKLEEITSQLVDDDYFEASTPIILDGKPRKKVWKIC